MAQGIYEIYCCKSGKRYIGSSKDIDKRWQSHISDLNNRIHHNFYLQKAWRMYGQDAFSFTVLEKVADVKDLFKVEEKYIKQYKFYNLFNIMKKPGAIPRKKSRWTRYVKSKKKQKKVDNFVWGV